METLHCTPLFRSLTLVKVRCNTVKKHHWEHYANREKRTESISVRIWGLRSEPRCTDWFISHDGSAVRRWVVTSVCDWLHQTPPPSLPLMLRCFTTVTAAWIPPLRWLQTSVTTRQFSLEINALFMRNWIGVLFFFRVAFGMETVSFSLSGSCFLWIYFLRRANKGRW